MKEKTKKILKGAGITLGAIALLGVGVGIGACSVKNGSTQPVTTTPIRKGLNQRPKKATEYNGAANLLEGASSERARLLSETNNGVLSVYSIFMSDDPYYDTGWISLNAGTYLFKPSPNNSLSWSSGLCVKADNGIVESAVALARLSPNQKVTIPSDKVEVLFGSDKYYIFNWSESDATTKQFCFSAYSGYYPELYLTEAFAIPEEDILELPDNWSPLRMVAKNVNKENNLIFDTDWDNWVGVPQANGQPMLDLSTILFKNQGRLYNHIYIYFKNLNGLKYATNSENIGTGTSSDWCADRVEYALVVDNSLRYNYLAASVGTSILQGQSVYNLGLNWSNSMARKLEILDKRYPSSMAITNTLTGRFPRTATSSLDPITNELIRPFGYGVWDYEYLLEYSNVTSVDFILGGSSDVFGIFTNAFNSVIPLLSVQVLPSISLGILLFLPLIGGIIVVIIRVIKK